jgi:hypothetical protein
MSVQASAETMRLLAQTSPGCAFEKASIDEAYINVTQLAVSADLCCPLVAGTHMPSLLPYAVVSAAYMLPQRTVQPACMWPWRHVGGPTCVHVVRAPASQFAFLCVISDAPPTHL